MRLTGILCERFSLSRDFPNLKRFLQNISVSLAVEVEKLTSQNDETGYHKCLAVCFRHINSWILSADHLQH